MAGIKSVVILSSLPAMLFFVMPGLGSDTVSAVDFGSVPDALRATDGAIRLKVPDAGSGRVVNGGDSTNPADAQLRKFLSELRSNPRETMNAEPPKYDAGTGERLRLPKHDKKSAGFAAARAAILNKRLSRHGEKARIDGNDTPQDLFPPGTRILTDIGALPDSGTVSKSPWSGYFWPVSSGGFAHRYRAKDYSIPNQPADFNTAQEKDRQQQINDIYSPAEKYDILMGDTDFTLTNAMIANKNSANVPPWVGYCHGWAPASYMEKRPEKAQVEVPSADGKYTIRFYNNDIRGLAALKWANSPANVYLIGGRCEGGMRDDNQHQLNQNCFDTNPGTWHIVVANMVGVERRSFIMDADADISIWNQPVLGYSAKYWNPLTEQFVPLIEARVPYSAFKGKDKFQKYRHPETAYIVGAEMKVSYVDDNYMPAAIDTDSIVEVVYRYDIELDSRGNIIGGEWYTNKHPDFLWTPVPGAKPINETDIYLSDKSKYDGSVDSLKQIISSIDIRKASSSDQSPLYSVVEGLIELSQ